MGFFEDLFGGGDDDKLKKYKKELKQAKKDLKKTTQIYKKATLEGKQKIKSLQESFAEQERLAREEFERRFAQQQQEFSTALAAAVPKPEAPPLDPDVALQQLQGIRKSRRKGRRRSGGIAGLVLSSLGSSDGGTLGGGAVLGG